MLEVLVLTALKEDLDADAGSSQVLWIGGIIGILLLLAAPIAIRSDS
jgi:hypothetical protein